jgi:ribonuclease HII
LTMGIPNASGFESATSMSITAQKIVQEIKEYLVVSEVEQTKRAEIEKEYRIEVAKIEAMRSILELHLNRSFKERRRNFEELFAVVRESIRKGDNDSLAVSLSSVVELAKISPLAEARSLTSLRQAMDDPDHEFKL